MDGEYSSSTTRTGVVVESSVSWLAHEPSRSMPMTMRRPRSELLVKSRLGMVDDTSR
jgi:hypothetical protein